MTYDLILFGGFLCMSSSIFTCFAVIGIYLFGREDRFRK